VANVGPVAVPATSAGVGGLGIGLMAMLAAVARRLVKPVVQAALRLALRLGRSWRYGGLASLPACQLASLPSGISMFCHLPVRMAAVA